MSDAANCPLCRDDGGRVLVRNRRLRVVLVDDADHPGFVRVIWNAHVAEMTQLAEPDRARLMAAVYAAENALRETLAPDKINLASLGNQVPHLHWHVIARFADDPHFPQPVWAARVRDADPQRLSAQREALEALGRRVRALVPAD